jgi:hypothetical protein
LFTVRKSPNTVHPPTKFLPKFFPNRSEALFVEKYGETLYREAGFTETAEKINGRLAQVGFVLALQNTFNGDVLDLMARCVFLLRTGFASN